MRKHYLLPSDFAGFAVTKFKRAKDAALKAKRELLAKENAEAVLRIERQGLGLIYKEKTVRSGFTLPTSYEGYWLIKPKKNTIIGKRVQKEMDDVCKLLDDWQWSTENALGIYESVYDRREFHNTVCYALKDDLVAVSQHKDTKHQLPEQYAITKELFETIIKEAI
jgi:hypothetical protein